MAEENGVSTFVFGFDQFSVAFCVEKRHSVICSQEEMDKALPDLEARFDNAMMKVYRRALNECGYNATRFLQMLYEHRGLETARILIHAPGVSDGYVALWERSRLDLTVEALILNNEWFPLFSDQEREIARKRLTDYGFKFGAAPGT